VREIRMHGSEGGGTELNRSFLPLSRFIEFFADTIRNANTPTPGRHTPGPS
jgi:hypothetical protein